MSKPGGILVIGGTGLVGNALVRAWTRRGVDVAAATYHCHESPLFRQLDIRDAKAVRATLAELSPSFVALPAANPHVDYCELHPEETRLTNVTGSLNVARACRDADIPLVFFSSDYVFDGRQGAYSEDDAPSPINEYGRQKAEVEAAVLALDARNLVVRTAGAYGWQWEPKNFALQVLARLTAGQAMKVVSDVRYNPTYAENLAEVTAELAAKGRGGVFNVVGAETIARDAFARRIAEAFGLDPARIEPASSKDFSAPAPRPKESSLKTDKVRAAVALPLMGAGEGLAHMRRCEADWRRYAEKLPAPPARSGR